MLPDRSVARRPLWGVALVSMLLAGCQEASTTPVVPAPAIAAGLDAAQPLMGRRARQAHNAEAHAARIAAAVDRGRGRVKVGAEARPALRRVLGAGFATSGITHARLTVLGADMRIVRTEPTPWTPATAAAIAPRRARVGEAFAYHGDVQFHVDCYTRRSLMLISALMMERISQPMSMLTPIIKTGPATAVRRASAASSFVS